MILQNQLDQTDKDILMHLLKDGRKSFVQIAKEMNISNSLVHQRMAKLRESGVIRGTRLLVNPSMLGYTSCAYTGIQISEGKYGKLIAEKLRAIPEVVECHYVSGKYALFIKVYAYNNDHLRNILFDQVLTIEGVAGTDTFISFKTEFERNVPIE